MIKNELHKQGQKTVFDENIQAGKRYLNKLVQKYRLNKLDYLGVCDLSRKIFNSFDLNGDGNLNIIETKLWLEAFSHEMNTLDTNFNS
jgi:hypothetical protein